MGLSAQGEMLIRGNSIEKITGKVAKACESRVTLFNLVLDAFVVEVRELKYYIFFLFCTFHFSTTG